MANVVAWYSPSESAVKLDGVVQADVISGATTADDWMALTYYTEVIRLRELLALARQEINEMTCAVLSARAELEDLKGLL